MKQCEEQKDDRKFVYTKFNKMLENRDDSATTKHPSITK